ncbi:MAG: sensor histidine kinase, partial [Microcystaceae cyanobacterium]
MTQQDRLLQNLSDLFNANDPEALIDSSYLPVSSSDDPATATLKAQSQWFGAIAALETLLLSINKDQEALILSGPTGLLSHPQLVKQIKTGIFTPEALKNCLLSPFQLPSADTSSDSSQEITELPLFPQDPISQEPFCLAFTAKFGLLMVLGQDQQGNPQFHFSFDPNLLEKGWKLLRSRLQLTHHPQLSYLDHTINQINCPEPDYRLVIE